MLGPKTLVQSSQELLQCMDSLENDLQVSLSSFAEIKADNNSLVGKLEVKDRQLLTLESNLAEKASEISLVQQNLALIVSEKGELAEIVSQLRREVDDSKETTENLTRRKDELERKIAELEKRDVKTAAEYNFNVKRLE